MEIFDLVCLLVGFLLFLGAGLNLVVKHVNLVALGLAAWILVPLVHAIQVLD